MTAPSRPSADVARYVTPYYKDDCAKGIDNVHASVDTNGPTGKGPNEMTNKPYSTVEDMVEYQRAADEANYLDMLAEQAQVTVDPDGDDHRTDVLVAKAIDNRYDW